MDAYLIRFFLCVFLFLSGRYRTHFYLNTSEHISVYCDSFCELNDGNNLLKED